MLETLALAALTTLVAQNAPSFLNALRDTVFNQSKDVVIDKGKELALKKGGEYFQRLLHLDKTEQIKHLEQALKNATERGLTRFTTLQERDVYRSVIQTLWQDGSQNELLRTEALQLFTFSDNPNFSLLNDKYNLRQSISAVAQNTVYENVDVTPYLTSFFNALIAELCADTYFKQQMSETLQQRAAQGIQQSLLQVVTTLSQIKVQIAHDYSAEQFAEDVKKYTEHIERTLHYLKIVGIALRDQKEDPELDGIFVPLRIETHDVDEVDDGRISIRHKPMPLAEALELHPCLVLLGGPGSGKSTAIRHLAWSHARVNKSASLASTDSLLSGNPLPLRIELRLFSNERKQSHHDFLSYATEVLLRREGVDIDPRMFKELLFRRTMLLLFDGLDEIATLDERASLATEIEHFTMAYPGNRVIVTSRPIGYDLSRISHPQFWHAEVQNFNNKQIRQFLERWYTYFLRLSPLPHADQQELEALFSTLRGNSRLHKLAENPLLLTVITALYRYERLPDRRILVYDNCAKLLLDTWGRLKGTNERWKEMKMGKEDQNACVAHLGFVLHERAQIQAHATSFPKEDISSDVPAKFMLREIERFIKDEGLIVEVAQQRKEAEHFLELMQVETGLIVERGTNENDEFLFGFVHRTFQEYFAAVDVYERFENQMEQAVLSNFLHAHLHDPHWHEVILLLLGKLRRPIVTNQLKQILQGNLKSLRSRYTDILQQDLFFICDCLVDEITVERELVESVMVKLGNIVKNSPIPAQRAKALDYFSYLISTQKYADIALKTIVTLTTGNTLPDSAIKLQAAIALYNMSSTDTQARQHITQVFVQTAQSQDTSFEDAVHFASTLYNISRNVPEERQRAGQALLYLAQQSTSQSVEQIITAIEDLVRIRLKRSKTSTSEQINQHNEHSMPQERREALALLLKLTQRSDLSVEQTIHIARLLKGWDTEQAIHLLLQIAQRPDISIEDTIFVAQGLYYRAYTENSEEKQRAKQLLIQLSQRSDISTQEVVRLYQTQYENSDTEEEQQMAEQNLLLLAERIDVPIEQSIQAADFLCRQNIEDSKKGSKSLQALSSILQRPTITIDQIIRVASILRRRSYPAPEQERNAVALLLQIAKNESVHVIQRLAAAVALEEIELVTDYNEEEARLLLPGLLQFIERHVVTASEQDGLLEDTTILDAPYFIELIQQRILSLREKDSLYQILNSLIPQFDKSPR